MSPVDLITISREFGAGGSELAADLGERLGWRVLDRDIAALVAARLRVDVGDVEDQDEHAPGILERLGSVALHSNPEFAPSLGRDDRPGADEIAQATRAVLLDAAREPAIIVGHGGQALFHGRTDALHVRLVAPLGQRVRRICTRTSCGDADAVGLARRMDADRMGYVRRYYHRDWHDPLLYHLQINTGAIALPEAASLVLALVEARGAGAGSTTP
jgi:cytidylate kinase